MTSRRRLLIALNVDVIIPGGTPSAVAAQKATHEIPILIVTVGDPVGSGLAASLRRPGGNVTGLTGLSTELSTKRLGLLRQILPGLHRRVGADAARRSTRREYIPGKGVIR